MQVPFRKFSSVCLLLGCALATLTMLMHPVGGSVEHISNIKEIFFVSHGIALLCIPFMIFGLWGFSTLLSDSIGLSKLALTIANIGMLDVFLAGTLNGLVLPQFAAAYATTKVDRALLQPVIDYGLAVNKSLTLCFIVGISLSIAIWSSLCIGKSVRLNWLGYYGWLISGLGIVAVFLNFNFSSVIGFGIYVFALSSWVVAAGFSLWPSKRV